MDFFIEYVKQFVSLTPQEENIILSRLKIAEYRKKAILFREGEVCENIFFVTKGIARTFQVIDGKDTTLTFEFSQDLLVDLYSATHNVPSKLNGQALSDLECIVCRYSDWLHLYELVPKLERFGRLVTERFFFMMFHLHQNENKTLKEKYLDLMHTHGRLFLQAPQKYIASYLGVKPESLSRIKKEVQNSLK